MSDAADVLLIGTGPPMLFEGLVRAKHGQKVMFVDQASCVGGSWKCPRIMGYDGVEVGVHLIENRPHLNAIFEALLEPDERITGHPDFGLWFKRRIPMERARILLYGGIAGRNLLRGKLERVFHSIHNMNEAVGYRNLPFIYPKTGMGKVLGQLEARLRDHGAVFHFNCPAQSIQMNGDGVQVATTDGALYAHHLVMSSRAHAPISGLESLWKEVDTDTVTSIVLRIDGATQLFDGYVEVINDRFIKRARNVTSFALPCPAPGTAMVTVQLRSAMETATPSEIRSHLVSLGLMDDQAEIVETFVDKVRLNTLPNIALAQIEATHGDRITVLRTVDLGDHKHDPTLFEP